MISIPLLLLALGSAIAVAVRERRHVVVVAVYALSLAFAVLSLMDAGERLRAGALAAVSFATMTAYVVAWSRRPHEPIVWIATTAAWLGVQVAIGDPPWDLVIKGPILLSCVVGGVCLYGTPDVRRTLVYPVGAPRWWLHTRVREHPPDVTTLVLAVLLVGDGAGLALLELAPRALRWEGRVQTAIVAALQIVHLARSIRPRTASIEQESR